MFWLTTCAKLKLPVLLKWVENFTVKLDSTIVNNTINHKWDMFRCTSSWVSFFACQCCCFSYQSLKFSDKCLFINMHVLYARLYSDMYIKYEFERSPTSDLFAHTHFSFSLVAKCHHVNWTPVDFSHPRNFLPCLEWGQVKWVVFRYISFLASILPLAFIHDVQWLRSAQIIMKYTSMKQLIGHDFSYFLR